MERFRRGDIQVLVATTVIEVGVDVPEATVMVVEDADRFGIAQLHQLRGRVGRSDRPSWCYLFSGASTPDAAMRLEALERSNDGFELAEVDLELRGEGAILGTRQKGRSDLKLASLRRGDRPLVEAARRVAESICWPRTRRSSAPRTSPTRFGSSWVRPRPPSCSRADRPSPADPRAVGARRASTECVPASVRVIAGSCRGRLLRAPAGTVTRPTSDRVREAIFDVLGSLVDLEGMAVVDLFAGSGAMGIEAISRGAGPVVFVDESTDRARGRSGATSPPWGSRTRAEGDAGGCAALPRPGP